MWASITYLILFNAWAVAFQGQSFRKQANPRTSDRQVTLSMQASADHVVILFDCDGVIVETEDLHRVAYNNAFKHFGLVLNGKPVVWDEEYYDMLQNTVGGGKPKMKFYFGKDKKQWPSMTKPYRSAPKTEAEQNKLVDMLQDQKNGYYRKIVEEIAKARPGVLELMDACIADPSVKVGICSASSREGFEKLVDSIVGKSRLSKMDVIIAGDDVSERKPSPMIYSIASQRIGVAPDRCLVIEDSLIGLKAAKAANMKCLITYTPSTKKEDFYGNGAEAILADLTHVKLADLKTALSTPGSELLPTLRDPKPSSGEAVVSPAAPTQAPTQEKVEELKVDEPPKKKFYPFWTPHMTITNDWGSVARF
jgi:HAD superfamily hydrolase (TIGR01509 family)